jgi:cell division protein FtsQ
VSKILVPLPHSRSWRDIPQQVKPRALSAEGRRRFTVRGLRLLCGLVTIGAAVWGGWEVRTALQRDPQSGLGGAALPIGDQVVAVTNGVLDKAWLVRTLALPRNATLMDIDPARLQARVVASGQVATAAIVRNFPRELAVHMAERSPVARVLVQKGAAAPQTFLVATDGVVYAGACYDPEMVKTLPWLDGVKLAPQGAGFAPLAGMASVAELLAQAKLEAAPLYRTWRVVSLARLAADGEIEVRTDAGLRVTFGARDNFFSQLARLDYLLDLAARRDPPVTLRSIDLALGSQVPVTAAAGPAAAPAAPAAGPARPAAPPPAPAFSFHISREL